MRGLHLRLDLIHGANGCGSATAMLARKMLAAKGTDNRQIADGNIALLLLPLSEDALNPFQGAVNSGRGNLRRLAERREDARSSG